MAVSLIQHSGVLQNGKATTLNSVEIKIVRTIEETLIGAVSSNGHFISLNADVINVLLLSSDPRLGRVPMTQDSHNSGRRSGSNTLPGSSALLFFNSRRSRRAIRGTELVMSHATACMARVEHPTKSLRQIVTDIQNTRAVTEDDVSFVEYRGAKNGRQSFTAAFSIRLARR